MLSSDESKNIVNDRKYGNLEKVLVLSNICWNFEKKLEEYSEKLCGNFKNLWEHF